jgi:hypothetical protein
MLTYAIDGWWGGAPVWFHLTNVACHVIASLMTFGLAQRLLHRRREAIACGVLFSVHPVHTEAVANIAGRPELLAAMFVMLALYACLRACQGVPRLSWFALAFGSTLLATFSKESAVTTPMLAALLLWWRAQPVGRRHIAAVCTVTVACALYLAARMLAVGTLGLRVPPPFVDNPLAHTSALPRIATALVVLMEYAGVLTVPIRLSADETFDQVPVVTAITDVRFLAAIGAATIVLVLVHRLRRNIPAAWYGVLFGVAALGVTANILFPIGTIKAERLLYLPSFGWCIAAAALVGRRPRVATRIIVSMAVLFAIRTSVRNGDWRDDYSLFSATAMTSPNSVRAQANAGAVRANQGEFDMALEDYTNAVRIYPRFAPAELGLGRLLEMRGRIAEAVRAYDAALESDPSNIEASLRAGDLHAAAGDFSGAVGAYRQGLANQERHPELLLGLAVVRALQGDAEDARALRAQVDDRLLQYRSVPQRLAALSNALGM